MIHSYRKILGLAMVVLLLFGKEALCEESVSHEVEKILDRVEQILAKEELGPDERNFILSMEELGLLKLGKGAAFPLQREFLLRKDPQIRILIVHAIGKGGASFKDAGSFLLWRVWDDKEDTNVRMAAIEALGLLNDLEAVPSLIRVASSNVLHLNLKIKALSTLGALKTEPVRIYLHRIVKDPKSNHDVRAVSLYYIRNFTDLETLRLLAWFLANREEDMKLRHAAYRSLLRGGGAESLLYTDRNIEQFTLLYEIEDCIERMEYSARHGDHANEKVSDLYWLYSHRLKPGWERFRASAKEDMLGLKNLTQIGFEAEHVESFREMLRVFRKVYPDFERVKDPRPSTRADSHGLRALGPSPGVSLLRHYHYRIFNSILFGSGRDVDWLFEQRVLAMDER